MSPNHSCSANLVSPADTKSVVQKLPEVPIPSVRTPDIGLLDEFNELNKIRNNLPIEELWHRYSQLLLKYLTRHKIGVSPPGVSVVDSNTDMEVDGQPQSDSKNLGQILFHNDGSVPVQGGNSVNKLIDQTVQTLPKTVQRTGRLLFNALAMGPNLSIRITSTGQIVLGTEIIQGSHIFDLVHYLLRPNRKHILEPVGWKNFVQVLKNTPSIPKSALQKVLVKRRVGPGVIATKGRPSVQSPGVMAAKSRTPVPPKVWETNYSTTDDDESSFKTPSASIKAATRPRSQSSPISLEDPEVIFHGQARTLQKRRREEPEREKAFIKNRKLK